VPIRDQAAQERSLANDYGPTRAAAAPAEFDVCLFDGDPMLGGLEIADTTEVDDGEGGTEVVANGYAPGVLDNDDWNAPDGGVMTTTAPVQFPTVLAEWPDTVTHWALRDPVTGFWWDCAPLVEPLDVTAAGPGPTVTLSLFYDNNLD